MLHLAAAVLAATALPRARAVVVLKIPAAGAEGGRSAEAGPFEDFLYHDGEMFYPGGDEISYPGPEWAPALGSKAGDLMGRPHGRVDGFPSRGPMSSPRWENRVLIAPKERLAFCYIEKNACTQFNRMINGLNGIKSTDKVPFWKSNSDGKYKDYFKSGLDSISRANGWNMTIFVREPAERFLSAWLSKCDKWEYGGIDCLGSHVSKLPIDKKVEAFEKTVVELLPQYMARSQMNGGFNAHYDPQHLFCGGRNMGEYDFVGVLAGSPAHISGQVAHMLEVHAGMSRTDPRMALPERLFPSGSRAGHGTGTVDLIRTFYRNRSILNMVMEQYAEDYKWASPEVRAAWAEARLAAGAGRQVAVQHPTMSAAAPAAQPAAEPRAATLEPPRSAPQAAPAAPPPAEPRAAILEPPTPGGAARRRSHRPPPAEPQAATLEPPGIPDSG